MKWLATAVALSIASLATWGIIDPKAFLETTNNSINTAWVYQLTGMRLAFGILLLLCATRARMTRVTRTIGALTIVGAILTPIIGVAGFRTLYSVSTPEEITGLRMTLSFAVCFILFIVYALWPAHDDGESPDSFRSNLTQE
jgi:hypothetical protein